MNKLSTRVADPSDVARVTLLLKRSYPALMGPAYSPEILAAALPLMTRANPALLACGTYYVAETRNGAIVGSGGWTREQPGTGAREAAGGHIRHFAADPGYPRRGIGRTLIERSIGEASAAGIVRLDCFSSLNAVPFYAAFGFETLALIDVRLTEAVALPSAHMRRVL